MHQSTIISCFSVDEFSRVHTIEDFLIFLNKCSAALWGTAAKPFDASQLIALGDRNNPNRYQSFQIKKKTHGFRTIHAPCEELKRIQKILSLVLTSFHHKNDVSFGFEIGKSIVDNARVHVKQEYILNIDLKDFFFSFNDQMVLKGLKKVGFITSRQSNDLVELILHLLTHDIDGLTAVLPQGSPASPIITNILCEELDNDLQVLANMYACKYSRYADDISFSSKTNVFKKKGRFYQELIKTIQSKYGLLVNEKKYRVLSKKYRQVVTGIVVNEELNVRRVFLKEIRMWLYYWERYGYRYANLLFLNKYAKDDLNSKALKSFLMGRINYIKQVKGFDSSTYLKYLSRIDQLIKREYKPIFKYAITLTHLDTTILNEAEYARAQNLLSKIDIAYVKANIFLKLQDFKNGSEYVVSRKNPFVFEYLGYNKKNIKAVLYVNTPEGSIKIGAVPDVRRFKLNINGKLEDFNPLNELHISAINPTFTHKVGNILQLTSEGKYFQELYMKMEKIYPELDAYADRALKGEDVTVTNGELKNFMDFNWQFNFIQNLNRTKLSDLGSYADFESEAPRGVVDGKRTTKKIKGKLIRISGKNKGYYIFNNEGITDVTSYLDTTLLNELEKTVTPDIETSHMTFYNKRVKVKNPDGTFSYVNNYIATGLKYPNNTNSPEVSKEFGQSFKSIVENFETVRQEVRKVFEIEGGRLNELEKSMKIIQSSNISNTEKKTRLDQLGLEIRSEVKEKFTGTLEKLGEKWLLGISKKIGNIEYPIDSIATVKLSGKANEVQFMFTMNGFTNSKGDYVPFRTVNSKGEESSLTLLFNVKEVTDEGVVLYTNAGKTATQLIRNAEDLLSIINSNLDSRKIIVNDGEIELPKVSSINKVDDNDLGNMVPDVIKNPFNISLSGDVTSKVHINTKPKSPAPQSTVITSAVVQNKSKSEMGLTDEELRGDIIEADFGEEEMAEQNATSSMFGVAPTQPKPDPESQSSSTESKTIDDGQLRFIIGELASDQKHPAEGALIAFQQSRREEHFNFLKSKGYTDSEIQKLIDDRIKEDDDIPMFSLDDNSSDRISIDTAKANLREILPANVSIQDIQNVLNKLKANGVPMGAVWNKVLYLNKAIKPGTEYHEAFHFVFKYFLNNAQRNALLKAAQNKYGKPTAEQLKKIENETDLRKGLSEKELTNIYYEELLADGFSQYKMSSESSQVYGVIELFYFNIVAGLYKIRRAWN